MTGKKTPYRNQKLALKFEAWQLFTFLSVILTVASGFLWFANIYPYQLEQEFAWLDQQKNTAYAQTLKGQQLARRSVDLRVQSDPQKVCQKKPEPLTKKTYNQQMQALSQVRQDLQQTQQRYQRNLFSLQKTANFTSLNKEAQKYVQNVKDYKHSRLLINEKIHTVATQLHTWCTQAEVKASLVQKLKQNLQELSQNSLVTNSAQKSFSQTQAALNKCSDCQPEEKQKLLQKKWPKQGQEMVVEKEFELEESQFKRELVAFERWQKQYLENHGSLEKRVVFIETSQKS
jgi:hypothetical protein